VRTSIATNPKMSYPATAPYQSGLHRAAGAAANPEVLSGEPDAARAAAGLSGLRQVVRDPRPSGVRAAARSPFAAGVEDDDAEATAATESGIGWKWVALAIALLALVGGLLAWRFGWLGGAATMQGGVLLLTRLRNPRLSLLPGRPRLQRVPKQSVLLKGTALAVPEVPHFQRGFSR
jgi:hypothetical protein